MISSEKFCIFMYNQQTNTSVYCIHPGAVMTNLFNHWMTSSFARMMVPFIEPIMKTPWHGAQTILYCLLEDAIGK